MTMAETKIEDLIAELGDLHRRVTELENLEAEAKHLEQLTAAAYGLPTDLTGRKVCRQDLSFV